MCRTALLFVAPLLAGCASGGASPLGEALQGLLPGDDPAAERATALPYASLVLDTGDRRGLVVMGAQAGDTSLWPTGNRGLITLHQEGLQATAGLPRDLLDTRYWPTGGDASTSSYVPWRETAPETFRMERSWQETGGAVARLSAEGRLECLALEPRELTLASLGLERCEQHLTWDDGRVTTATLWREPVSRRLWAVAETAWPGGPRIAWEVARPWW
jgi:hypothetical protein